MDLSRFSDALGKPRQGFHAARIPVLDIALWDTVGTIAIAGGLAWALGGNVPFWILFAFALGVILHWVFGVKTRVATVLRGGA